MTKQEAIERARRAITANAGAARDTLQKWQSRCVEDPMYAFEWGDGAIKAMCELRVAEQAERCLADYEAGKITARRAVEWMDQGYDNAMDQAFQSSTSQMSNLTKRTLGEVWHNRWLGAFGYRMPFLNLP